MNTKNIEDKVLEFAKMHFDGEGFVGIRELKEWKGKRIFVPKFDRSVIIGIHYIEVDGDKINLVSGEDTREYLDFYAKSLTPEELEKEMREVEELAKNSEKYNNID